MALINPETGSSQFNAIVRRDAVISLAGDVPVIISQDDNFNIKLLSDALTGEEISHKDLIEVPAEEIGEDGIWIKAQAAKLKSLSQEELIAMVLELQGKVAPTTETEEAQEPEPEIEEPAVDEEEPVKETKPKTRRKKPTPKAEEVEESGDEEVDVAF